MSEDSSDKVDRRKVLTKAIPFMLNALWEAHSAMNPGKLATLAADRYRKIENEIKSEREEILVVLGKLPYLDLEVNGTGRLSLTLSREHILALIERYLSTKFANEGGKSAKSVATSPE